jgi:hypothetical protein
VGSLVALGYRTVLVVPSGSDRTLAVPSGSDRTLAVPSGSDRTLAVPTGSDRTLEEAASTFDWYCNGGSLHSYRNSLPLYWLFLTWSGLGILSQCPWG